MTDRTGEVIHSELEEPITGTRLTPAEQLEPETELFTVNIGPQHPATHGVLRLFCTLEGEVVRDVKPLVGYVHTGIEKSCEDHQYWKTITFVERMDYLSYYCNAMAFSGSPTSSSTGSRATSSGSARPSSTSARSRRSSTRSGTASGCSTCSRCRAASACTPATSR